MKLLTMLAACLIAANVYGQIPAIESGAINTDSIPKWMWTIQQDKMTQQKTDTIQVVMLVCDTSSTQWVDSGIVNGKLVQIGEKHKVYRNRSVIWVFGYSVRRFDGYYSVTESTYLVYHQKPIYAHFEYLDEDKKPLINKIVWMAKEVGSNR
jgi:hypothetical protein